MIRNCVITLSLVLLTGFSIPAPAQNTKSIVKLAGSSSSAHLAELIKSGQIEMIRLTIAGPGGVKTKNFKMINDDLLLIIDGDDSYYLKLEFVPLYRVSGKVLYLQYLSVY